MPVYEFFCETCGPFESRRSFEEASNPMRCPLCDGVVRRVYSLPGLVKTPSALASALYSAEKSAYEPKVLRRQSPTGEASADSATITQGHGRPWQLRH